MITKFTKLSEPFGWAQGRDWVIYSWTYDYRLGDDLNLHKQQDVPKGVRDIFRSEVELHEFANAYYVKHNQPYPYMAEWMMAVINECKVPRILPGSTGTVESEVMEFI